MTRNQDVAKLLYEISQILEIQGVPFKPRAYQRAALNVEALGEDIEAVAQEGRLGTIPGVGAAIEEKIETFLKTGKLPYLEKIRRELPPGVLALLSVPGIGPKTALRLNKELKIATLDELEKAAKAGRIRALKGFGEKSEKEILESLARVRTPVTRLPYPTVYEVAQDIKKLLLSSGLAETVEAAGSIRRGRDTVGDLDILAIAPGAKAEKLVAAFTAYPDVDRVLESGSTRARVLLKSGLQVDFRVVPKESFGAALQYFTGSKDHNIALRTRALKKGWTINEYALSRKKDGKHIAGETEEEIYEKLGLAYVPPELRENVGEIELAEAKKIPRLIELEDLRGDLHTHTTESDGHASAEKMLEEAQRLGYEWFGISDHSKGLGVARGLDGTRYAKQRKALDKLQEAFPSVQILQGAEVNIRKDGRLDLDANEMTGLDYVVGSVHSSFNLPKKEQTTRVIRAVESGVDILGHPSTRLLGERGEIDMDWDKVFEAAKKAGATLEINAGPFRLDLAGERVRVARERGLPFAIDSDAHTTTGLRVMHFGVTQARRGGLEAGRVVNTFTAAKLRTVLRGATRR